MEVAEPHYATISHTGYEYCILYTPMYSCSSVVCNHACNVIACLLHCSLYAVCNVTTWFAWTITIYIYCDV